MLQRTFAGTTDDQGVIPIVLKFNGSMYQPVTATKVAIKTVTCYFTVDERDKKNAVLPVDCDLSITVTPSDIDPVKFLMDELFPRRPALEDKPNVQGSVEHAGCDKCVPMFEICQPQLVPLDIKNPVSGRNFTVTGTLTFASKGGPLKGTKVAGRFFLYFDGDPVAIRRA
jgi:hypothetical protein